MSNGRSIGPPAVGGLAALLTLALVVFVSLRPLAAADTLGIYETAEQRFSLVKVVEGLEHPWGLAFLPDGRMLVTERPGRLRIIADGRLDPEPIAGAPNVRDSGQGGLLDVALHPQFAENRLVYLSYASPGDGGAATAVARGTLAGKRLVAVEELYVALPRASGGRHFGSRLLFADGYLFVTASEAIRTGPRRSTIRPARSSAFMTTAACRRTTPTPPVRTRGPRSTPTATAIPKAWRERRRRGGSTPSSTVPRAGTS